MRRWWPTEVKIDMARPSYLRQITKQSSLGLQVLKPPFAPFGPPQPSTIAFREQPLLPADVTLAEVKSSSAGVSNQTTPEAARNVGANAAPSKVTESRRSSAHSLAPGAEAAAPDAEPPVPASRGRQVREKSAAVNGPEQTPQAVDPDRVASTRTTSRKINLKDRSAMSALSASVQVGDVGIRQVEEENPSPPLMVNWPEPKIPVPFMSPDLTPARHRRTNPTTAVHIGSIEVHIATQAPPCPIPPTVTVPEAQKPTLSSPTSSLSRGYVCFFGLRQS